jgi:hypothetical protein
MVVTSAPTTAPLATTLAATGIGASFATLNGTVNANGQSTTDWFEIGTGTSYGTIINATPGTVTGNSVTPVTGTVSGLAPNSTYHFRCVAQNIGGTTNGADMVFTTICPIPEPAGDIAGPASVCQATTDVVYGVPDINWATGYVWTVPTGATITAGSGYHRRSSDMYHAYLHRQSPDRTSSA